MSTSFMAEQSFVKKTVSVVFVLLLVATVALVTLLYFSNRSRETLAERMMSDAARLELGADMAEVRMFAEKYKGTQSASWQQNPCTPSDCLVVTKVSSGVFSERHPKLESAYQTLLHRYWSYSVFIWVKNRRMSAQQQWFTYETPNRTHAVITEMSQGSAKALCDVPSYHLHNTFTVGMAPHHFNVWVAPNAHATNLISKLNLDCVGGIRGCRDFSEMAPNAWQRYEQERGVLASISTTEADEAISTCKQKSNGR